MCKNEDANLILQTWKEAPASIHAQSTFTEEPTS